MHARTAMQTRAEVAASQGTRTASAASRQKPHLRNTEGSVTRRDKPLPSQRTTRVSAEPGKETLPADHNKEGRSHTKLQHS